MVNTTSWVLFNKVGESKVLNLDKYYIFRRYGIHGRFLRILDPSLNNPSCLLGRESAIVVSLEHIKAIISADEVLLRNPCDEDVIPVVAELESGLASHGGLSEGHGDEDDEAADFPFEFRALEVMLEAVCSHLDARTTELEAAAHPALDALKSKISSRSLDSVRKLKSGMTRLANRVKKVRDELEELLDDDEDMADLYLSRNLSTSSSPVSCSYASNCYPPSPAVSSKVASRVGGVLIHEDNDVEELAMLLEAYFKQIDSTMNKLTTLREYVDDIEDYIRIKLDNRRNKLIQLQISQPPRLELILCSVDVCLAVYSLIGAIFGMNIPFEWNYHHGYIFKWVVILGGMASAVIFLFFMAYARHRGVRLKID